MNGNFQAEKRKDLVEDPPSSDDLLVVSPNHLDRLVNINQKNFDLKGSSNQKTYHYQIKRQASPKIQENPKRAEEIPKAKEEKRERISKITHAESPPSEPLGSSDPKDSIELKNSVFKRRSLESMRRSFLLFTQTQLEFQIKTAAKQFRIRKQAKRLFPESLYERFQHVFSNKGFRTMEELEHDQDRGKNALSKINGLLQIQLERLQGSLTSEPKNLRISWEVSGGQGGSEADKLSILKAESENNLKIKENKEIELQALQSRCEHLDQSGEYLLSLIQKIKKAHELIGLQQKQNSEEKSKLFLNGKNLKSISLVHGSSSVAAKNKQIHEEWMKIKQKTKSIEENFEKLRAHEAKAQALLEKMGKQAEFLRNEESSLSSDANESQPLFEQAIQLEKDKEELIGVVSQSKSMVKRVYINGRKALSKLIRRKTELQAVLAEKKNELEEAKKELKENLAEISHLDIKEIIRRRKEGESQRRSRGEEDQRGRRKESQAKSIDDERQQRSREERKRAEEDRIRSSKSQPMKPIVLVEQTQERESNMDIFPREKTRSESLERINRKYKERGQFEEEIIEFYEELVAKCESEFHDESLAQENDSQFS